MFNKRNKTHWGIVLLENNYLWGGYDNFTHITPPLLIIFLQQHIPKCFISYITQTCHLCLILLLCKRITLKFSTVAYFVLNEHAGGFLCCRKSFSSPPWSLMTINPPLQQRVVLFNADLWCHLISNQWHGEESERWFVSTGVHLSPWLCRILLKIDVYVLKDFPLQ